VAENGQNLGTACGIFNSGAQNLYDLCMKVKAVEEIFKISFNGEMACTKNNKIFFF